MIETHRQGAKWIIGFLCGIAMGFFLGRTTCALPDISSVASSSSKLTLQEQQQQIKVRQEILKQEERKRVSKTNKALPKGLSKDRQRVKPQIRRWDLDTEFVFNAQISGHQITVGRQGPAVRAAIQNRLKQSMVGFARKDYEALETQTCVGSSPAEEKSWSLQKIRSAYLPEAILIGVQKGGTTALYKYLDQHPNVVTMKKEIYFLDRTVDDVVLSVKGGGIPQKMIRGMFSKRMRQSIYNESTYDRSNMMVMDMTPNYMFESDRLPARIKCIVPWVKLFCLLRNPVDRARSQYDMKIALYGGKPRLDPDGKIIPKKNEFRQPLPSIDKYIRLDFEALKETGVIQDWNVINFDDFWNSPAMWEAWRTYLNSGTNAPIGMGLYAIQLQPFLELPNEFLAIRSEDLQHKTDETFGKALDFLGLPRITLDSYTPANTAKRHNKMSNETLELLSEVFKPWNRKLAELLGDEWDGVWDH